MKRESQRWFKWSIAVNILLFAVVFFLANPLSVILQRFAYAACLADSIVSLNESCAEFQGVLHIFDLFAVFSLFVLVVLACELRSRFDFSKRKNKFFAWSPLPIFFILLFLLAIPLPQSQGSVCGFCPSNVPVYWKRQCVGIEIDRVFGCSDCATKISCIGVPEGETVWPYQGELLTGEDASKLWDEKRIPSIPSEMVKPR